MTMLVGEREASLLAVVGAAHFLAARRCLAADGVRLHGASPDGDEAEGWTTRGFPAHVSVNILRDDAGQVEEVETWCDCREAGCVHPVALALLALGHGSAQPAGESWERALGGLLEPEREPATRIGLQFDLRPDAGFGEGSAVELRPVTQNRKGRWVRQGISWSVLEHRDWELRDAADEHVRLLQELLTTATGRSDRYGYGYGSSSSVQLADIRSRRLWDLLAEAAETGLPMVQAGPRPVPVTLHPEAARAATDLRDGPGGLELAGVVEHDGGRLDPARLLLVGDPAHGVAWWTPDGDLHLARLRRALSGTGEALVRSGPVTVPPVDQDRFLTEYLPALHRRADVRVDPAVSIPEVEPPLLRVTVAGRGADRVRVEAAWTYRVGARVREASLVESRQAWRDPLAERAALDAARTAGIPTELLHRGLDLAGVAAARFVAETVPALRELDGLEVVVDVGDRYREVTIAPEVTVTDAGSGADRDWFDLEVQVRMDGEEVPFTELYLALARGEPYLLLPSGAYFRLDREEFDRLARLIAEARALDDVERDPNLMRLSRFQAGLWAELEELGVVAGEAAAWQESVRALRDAPDVLPVDAPAGLRAELRPYQLAGFNWLAALHRFRLGGILADDMGLGKTVQALALVQHVHEQDPAAAPFLVVAPTTVVANWATEAARFTPGLPVAVITETARRRGVALAAAVAGAKLVVTSYTLLRLECDDYEVLPWAGVILDEAQMVKNHQARGYGAARRVPAPFKLAITGTPMENHLMELWSLLSITAPGLFASPARFTDHYRRPIEKNKDAGMLDQLRTRIRPLVLRRTKGEVLAELPEKQEQVLSVELNPKHRKGYQVLLNRERQKILGLLDDLDGNRFEIFRSLTLLRQAALDLRLVDAEAYADVPPTKLDDLVELMTEAAAEGHRTLVFSQFTRFLKSARSRLEGAGVTCSYLDGRTADRATVIEGFKSGSDPAFLISLKAGGFGLNLTEADYCILLDPWWNPATEAQAVDRVHRIGQKNAVMVYRLVANGTIEEKVMALKAEKAALVSSVLDGGDLGAAVLSADDIRSLLS